MTLLLSPQHIASYRKRPTNSAGLPGRQAWPSTSTRPRLCASMPFQMYQLQQVVNHFTWWRNSPTREVLSQRTMQHRRTSRQGLGKLEVHFAAFQPAWKSRQCSLRMKLRLYNSMVKPVGLYGSECWRVVKGNMDKISAFHNGCLRRICRIFWPNKFTNDDSMLPDGLGMSLVWTRTASPRLPSDGHHLEEGSKSSPWQLGDIVWWPS